MRQIGWVVKNAWIICRGRWPHHGVLVEMQLLFGYEELKSVRHCRSVCAMVLRRRSSCVSKGDLKMVQQRIVQSSRTGL